MKAFLLLCSLLILIGCKDAPRSIADEIMEDLRTGEIRYSTDKRIGKKLIFNPSKFLTSRSENYIEFYDPWSDRMTDYLIEDYVANKNECYDHDESIKVYHTFFFDIPKSILSYEFIKSEHNEGYRLFKVMPAFSYRTYKVRTTSTLSHLKQYAGLSYEQYVKKFLEECKGLPDFQRIGDCYKFTTSEPFKVYYYRVTTINGIFRVSVLLFKNDTEAEELDAWSCGSITSEPI